jgi:hypothetical protein
MNVLFWLTHNGRSVGLHRTLEGAQAQFGLVRAWREQAPLPGRLRMWKADTCVASLKGVEVREIEAQP